MLKLDTRAELEALHAGGIQESLTLEYKASGVVDGAQKKKEEIAKDASAFANAAGGQIVYGMKEQDHLPAGLDDGLDPSQFSGIWFEQVIQQNVSSPIDGLRIHEVPLDERHKRIAVVVTVPPAQGRAPHQAKDGRYYRRHNFANLIMNDSEVRDTMRRATTPELFVRLQFENGRQVEVVEFERGQEISKGIVLRAFVGNRSPQPASYTVVLIGFDADLRVDHPIHFAPAVAPRSELGSTKKWMSAQFSSPPEQPIFQEAEPVYRAIRFSIGSDQLDGTLFSLTTVVQTPGYSATENWPMICEGGRLTLCDPTHP